MTTIFDLSGLLVLPFWALMIVAPAWGVTRRLVSSPLIVAGPMLVYAALVLPDIANVLPLVMQPKLPEIAALLGTERGATIGWMHFLAFDLFVGRWVFLDARERRISPLVTSPILFFVLMLGPIGLAAYFCARALRPSGSATA
jgi:hypothetical protein